MTGAFFLDGKSSIPSLFREWKRQYEIASAAGASESNVADAAVDQMFILKNAMFAIPSITLQDLATKLTVSSQGGHNEIDMAIIGEAEQLARDGDDEAPPRPGSKRLMDVEDKLASVRSLNDVIFMAAAGIGDRHHMDAIQTVADIIENKLLEVRDELEAIREDS